MIQNTHGFTTAHTVAGSTQQVPGGPVASQVAIKQLGTNGGGFFNVNSTHPFEGGTKLGDFVELYAILIIPFALAFTFGRLIKQKRQGYAVVAVMGILWLASAIAVPMLESGGNPKLDTGGVTQAATSTSPGGNMEGKEVRNGPVSSGIWGGSTTGTSNGSVNSMHESYTPLGGMVVLTNMKLGEISPGGVGVGLNGLLILAILSVFIAGLMVGRTPEYLGKKIQAAEVKLVAIYILVMPALVMVGVAIATFVGSVKNVSLLNPGAHGFTELLYAFTSAANNNGSAFAGITANTAFMNSALAIVHAVRPILPHHPDAGDRGLGGAQAARPRDRRHVPDRHATVRRVGDRRGGHRRRPGIPSCAGARPHRRAVEDLIEEHRQWLETPSWSNPRSCGGRSSTASSS